MNRILWILLLLPLVAVASNADDLLGGNGLVPPSRSDSDAYININAGYGQEQSMPNGAFAGALNAGYNFTDYFALEGGYTYTTSNQYGGQQSNNIIDVATKFTYHATDNFGVYARVGIGYQIFNFGGENSTAPSWYSTYQNTQYNVDAVGGIGLSYAITQHVDLRVEDTIYLPIGCACDYSTNNNLILGGVQYNF